MGQRREDQNRVPQLKRCLMLIDEILSLVPTQQEMPRSVRHKVGYYFVESCYEVSPNYDESGKVLSQSHVMTAGTLPLCGVPIDWKRITKLRSRLAIELGQCGIEYPDQCNIEEERDGDRTLVHEVAWRLCMRSLRENLESLTKDEEGSTTKTDLSSDRPPEQYGRWPDADRDAIRDSLSNQTLKLFNLLWGRDRWTSYGILKNSRVERLWRGQPDPDSINDNTVFEALRKLQKAMQPDWPYSLKIENESKRAKIIPPEIPSP